MSQTKRPGRRAIGDSYRVLAILLLAALTVLGCNPTPTPVPMVDAGVTDVAPVPSPPVVAPHTVLDAPEQPVAPPPKVDTRTPTQKAADEARNLVAGCTGPHGEWMCPKVPHKALMAASGNATAAQCGPACTVGAWWFDPANTTGCASDGNSGTSATCGAAGSGIGPLATFAQIILRLGSTIPQYPPGQSVAVTQLSAQPANTDVIFFEPHLSNGGQAILTVVPVAVGAPQTITVSTAKSRGAPGTLLTLKNPTGVAAKQLVINTTRSSQAIVDSVAGTTVMQQPQTTASLTTTAIVPYPVDDDTWATGDTVRLYTLQNCNLKRWRPVGGDFAAAVPGGGWVFTASVPDTSAAGNSSFNCGAASVIAFVNCVFNGQLAVGAENGKLYSSQAFFCGSSAVQTVSLTGGSSWWYGGAVAGGVLVTAMDCYFLDDAILHSYIVVQAGIFGLGDVYSDGAFSSWGALVEVYGFVWGSYSVTLNPGGRWCNSTDSTFVLKALLTTGALRFGSATAGATYTADSGVWSAGNVALTPTAIDRAPGGAIVNPLTGAGFSSSQ